MMTNVTRNQLVTLEDLDEFRERLISEFKRLIDEKISPVMPRKMAKVYEVREMLNLSPGTCKNFDQTARFPIQRWGCYVL